MIARGLLPLLPLLLVLAGCAGASPAPEAETFRPEVAPITSGSSAPDEVAARALLVEGKYDEAYDAFKDLATYEVDSARRAEFLFFTGEAALAAERHEEAYEAYRKLLRRYPASPRYPLVVERVFLIGRRYAEGRAESASWFFGLEVSDRDLGIQILEEFQKAREQHPLADDALHEVALARVAQKEYGLAIESWQKLVEEYPRREWADTAEYRIGTTFIAMSDGVEYDKRPILTGLERLRRYVERHPTGNHLAEARQEIARVEEDLADHQLDVARFYLKHDHRYAAVVYLDDVVREYPRTDAAREAQRLKTSMPAVQPPPPPPDDEGPLPEVDYQPLPAGPDASPPDNGLIEGPGG